MNSSTTIASRQGLGFAFLIGRQTSLLSFTWGISFGGGCSRTRLNELSSWESTSFKNCSSCWNFLFFKVFVFGRHSLVDDINFLVDDFPTKATIIPFMMTSLLAKSLSSVWYGKGRLFHKLLRLLKYPLLWSLSPWSPQPCGLHIVYCLTTSWQGRRSFYSWWCRSWLSR